MMLLSGGSLSCSRHECVGRKLIQHRAEESHDRCVFPCLQSILTGESGSVEKHLAAVQDPKAVYQDKTCLLYSVSPCHYRSLLHAEMSWKDCGQQWVVHACKFAQS